jgi:CBS domain-containing protein
MATNFEELLKKVQETKTPVKTTPKNILEQLGVSRRGWRVVEAVKQTFEKYEVICEPEFGTAWAYGEVEIKPKPKVPAKEGSTAEYDPTPRVSMLEAANLTQLSESSGRLGLVTVNRDELLSSAVHKMMTHNFSQLPIMSGRTPVGMVSWRSIGMALALGKKCTTVNDCKEEATVLDEHELLFEAVKVILQKEVVLVKRKDGIINGIITATDIGEQFISMAEPFLLIEQIENHIRKLLDEKFTTDQLKAVRDPNDTSNDVKTLADLNFGAYIRLISKPENFQKLGIQIDRVQFITQLDEIREIRNDVMHFDPDAIDPKELELLRRMVAFLSKINAVFKDTKKNRNEEN